MLTFDTMHYNCLQSLTVGAQCVSGRVLDSRPRAVGSLESLHCVIEQEH